MNYIGIRGHRGAGKQTVSYLLGCTINYLIEWFGDKGQPKLTEEEFKKVFIKYCDEIIANENIVNTANLKRIYFDSFGDGPKTFVSLLLGCDPNMTYSDYHKDHTIVNLHDFSYETYETIPEYLKCLDAEELYKIFSNKKEPTVILKNTYTTLREFIMYFGKEVMQRHFGLNVWVKTLKANEERYSSSYNDQNYYKIFTDLKFPSEVTYIKDKKGVVVKVSRPGFKKKGSDKLSQDDRYDYEVVIGDNLYDLQNTIWDIAIDIINNNDYGKEEN